MIQLPSQLVKEVTILDNVIRYGDLPAKKTLNSDTAVFFIAGQKSPLERFFPMAEYFAQYYRTYAYEIPGMGIACRNPQTPATIDALGDEIALFINKVVEEKNVIIIAASAGFWFSTQALLKDIQARSRVKKIVSIVGMLGKDTFGFSKLKRTVILALCRFILSKPGARLIELLISNDRLVSMYAKYLIRRRKLGKMPLKEQQEYEEFEQFLLKLANWDIHFSTIEQYLTTDTPMLDTLKIPLFALYTAHDQFFPYENQKRMFSKVYTAIEWDQIHLKAHAPLIVKNFDEYKDVIPEQRILDFLNS